MAAISAVHSGIFLATSLAFDLVRILHRAGERSRKRVDEHTSRQILRPLVRCLAHLTSRLLVEIKLILLEAFLTEGVQAGKGLWFLDSLVAKGTFDQLGNYR